MMVYLKIYKDTGILKWRKMGLRTISGLLSVASDARYNVAVIITGALLAISHAWIQSWDVLGR